MWNKKKVGVKKHHHHKRWAGSDSRPLGPKFFSLKIVGLVFALLSNWPERGPKQQAQANIYIIFYHSSFCHLLSVWDERKGEEKKKRRENELNLTFFIV